jgi:hypothetical protein
MTYDTCSPMAIALSLDEKILYVGEAGLGEKNRELRAYPVHDDGSLGIILCFTPLAQIIAGRTKASAECAWMPMGISLPPPAGKKAVPDP